MKRILIGCEESQTVCKAFRERGFEAYSCDVQDCSGGHPEWHIKGDLFSVINDGWDLGIFHPPCTFMSNAGACRMYPKAGQIDAERFEKAMQAKAFFMQCLSAKIPFVAVENPVPLRCVELPPHSQAVQPYEFGHSFSKKTLLWLVNLPPLLPSCYVYGHEPYLPSNTSGKLRGEKYHHVYRNRKDRSKTFPGIAAAMAEQWGDYIMKRP